METDVTSVHWNTCGDKMVTSSSDCFARVWKVDEVVPSDETGLMHKAKNFGKTMLMMSKFNKERADLIATGGHSPYVTVWNAEDPTKQVVRFDHTDRESAQFVCKEIEWKNTTELAISGVSKNIYLWSVDCPAAPIRKWSGHNSDIAQI
jgi:transducin (beta)-like 1